ncbi:SLBB domain-containing protein [Photobacterium nomapromontoriensis]|uniref:SLBB domain-containing protein n=1 Tax=Photobacterium nomapromontoriensis TaxID=2910237 RepID=UPI003D0AD111
MLRFIYQTFYISLLFISYWTQASDPPLPKVQVGDLIAVYLPGEEHLQQNLNVDRQGRITLPEVGAVTVVGLTEAELKSRVKKKLSVAFRDLDHLSVYIKETRVLVQVLGYVAQPGQVLLHAGAGIQMALRQAGGVRSGAQLDKLQLRRDGSMQVFNYKAYLDSGEESHLPPLRSLDTLFVPASPMIGNIEVEFDAAKMTDAGDAAEDRNAVKVFGEVNSPGSFSYKPNISLVDLLMRAGGVTRYAGVEQIRVINNGQPTLFNLKRYLDTGDAKFLPTLSSGATIFVPMQEEEIKSGANTVYVMGEVFKPGAFEGKAGATFMDILANAGGPTRFAESRQIRIIHANGKVRPFDLAAYTEGLVTTLPNIRAGDAIFVPEKTDINEKSWLKVSPNRAVRVIGEVVRPGRFEWADEMNLMDLLAHAGGPKGRADTENIEVLIPDGAGNNRMVVFNLDKFIKQGYSDNRLPKIRAGTVIRVHDLPQDPSDNKAQWVRQSSDKSIYILGQVGAPGRYRFNNDMTFLDILAAADGPTGNADIHNIRVSHSNKGHAQVTKIDLGLYFETGDGQLLPDISTGDTIYIPEKDRIWLNESKENTVRVLGAVNRPGRYRFNDSMTILDLLAEAGGTNAEAYVSNITVVNVSCCKDQARSFDLTKFTKTADFSSLPVIRNGDTVYVPDRKDSTPYQAREALSDIFRLVSLAALLGLI